MGSCCKILNMKYKDYDKVRRYGIEYSVCIDVEIEYEKNTCTDEQLENMAIKEGEEQLNGALKALKDAFPSVEFEKITDVSEG